MERKKKCVPDSVLGDTYDGNIWDDFSSESKAIFFLTPHNYILALNVGWFQPFTHSVYSVGAIYMTILNLPRHERHKE